MSKGLFTERLQKPSEKEISAALSSKKTVWKKIINFIERDLASKGELKFYGKNYGWALRFTKRGMSLAALYPCKNDVTVQIILNSEQVNKALQATIGQRIKDIIASTPAIHEGRWLFITMEDDTEISDIKKLISIRAGIGTDIA